MRSVTADTGLVACCGLYCGACKSYLSERCDGCRKSMKNSWCKVKQCAAQKGISTCANCGEYENPMDCRKFNNFVSRAFGWIFNSNRPACVEEIRQMGLKLYAGKMAEMNRHTLPRS